MPILSDPSDLAYRKTDPDLSWFRYLAVSREDVEKNFRRFDLLDDRVKFVKGWFSDTLPTAPIDKIAILRLDSDHYSSTMDALNALYQPAMAVHAEADQRPDGTVLIAARRFEIERGTCAEFGHDSSPCICPGCKRPNFLALTQPPSAWSAVLMALTPALVALFNQVVAQTSQLYVWRLYTITPVSGPIIRSTDGDFDIKAVLVETCHAPESGTKNVGGSGHLSAKWQALCHAECKRDILT